MSLEKLVIIPRTASELVGLQGLPQSKLARAKTGYVSGKGGEMEGWRWSMVKGGK